MKELIDKWTALAVLGVVFCVFAGMSENIFAVLVFAIVGGACVGRVAAEARRKGRR